MAAVDPDRKLDGVWDVRNMPNRTLQPRFVIGLMAFIAMISERRRPVVWLARASGQQNED
jgi:hypothetical protein